MRIGLLTTSFPRDHEDHAGSFVLGFARALVSQGHELEVLAPEPHEPRYKEPTSFAGIDVRWVRYLPRPLERTFYGAGVIDNLQRDPLSWLGLAPFTAHLGRLARRRATSWDAVVSHWALPCALIAAGLPRRPHHLAVMHSGDVFLLERLPGSSLFAARIARGAHQLLFVSRDLRRRFLALLDPLERVEIAARSHVCAMGIEPKDAPAPREQLRRELGITGLCVLSLGRLVPIKGLEDAIAALGSLEGVELCIAGDGPSRPELEHLAHNLGARVRFLGPVHGAHKQAWLHAADVFVLPSRVASSGRTEGVPTALLEAMAAGLVPIATRTGGIPDVVEHAHNGLLVEPESPAALREALERLRDPRLRAKLAKAARATADDYGLPRLGPLFARLLTPNEGDAEGRRL